MQSLSKLTLSAALVCLGSLLAAADTRPARQTIEFWPDLGGFDSMLPNARQVHESTNEEITGTVAYLVGYIERPDAGPRPEFEPRPREVFIYATKSGRYIVRFSPPWPEHRRAVN